MPRGNAGSRKDSNHDAVTAALMAIGAKVQSLAAIGNGVPDLLVGFRDLNFLIEVKNGDEVPSRRVLTSDQSAFHARWPGQVAVAYSPEEAVRIVIAVARSRGSIPPTERFEWEPAPQAGLFEGGGLRL